MNHTLRKAFDYYLEHSGIQPGTKPNIFAVRKKLEEAELLDVQLYKLTPAVVRSFIHSLNVSEATACTRFRSLKTALTFYVRSHALPIRMEIFAGIIPSPKKKSADSDDFEGGYLTLSEVKALINWEADNVKSKSHKKQYTDADIRDLFVLMCFTGMAISDLLKFNPEENLKEENGTLWLKYRRTKNNQLCRIPIGIPNIPTLEYIQKFSWPIAIGARGLQVRLKALGRLFAEGTKRLNPHMGRHTFGCIMLESGFSMEVVSSLMGHSSIQTTQRIYAKVSRDMIEKEFHAISQKQLTP